MIVSPSNSLPLHAVLANYAINVIYKELFQGSSNKLERGMDVHMQVRNYIAQKLDVCCRA
jgi:hypothetical protein